MRKLILATAVACQRFLSPCRLRPTRGDRKCRSAANARASCATPTPIGNIAASAVNARAKSRRRAARTGVTITATTGTSPAAGGYYYADQYYRDGRYYRERRLSYNDRIYRGRDGRYYCRRSDGTTGLIIGAGVGALIGNRLDNGRSSLLGTLIGAAAGGAIGREIDRDSVATCAAAKASSMPTRKGAPATGRPFPCTALAA